MTAPLRSDPTTVRVALGARSYDIVIGRGLLVSLGARIARLRPGAKVAIVTDENVARCHLAAAEASLADAGVAASRIIVPVGEGSKSFHIFERVCEAIIAERIERGDLVVALGQQLPQRFRRIGGLQQRAVVSAFSGPTQQHVDFGAEPDRNAFELYKSARIRIYERTTTGREYLGTTF